MKNPVLHSEDKLKFSTEYVLKKDSPWGAGIILVISGVLVAVILFICFGKMEEVVKAQGIVRPELNVSQVKSILAGEIEEICFIPGQFVQKGSVLARLNQDELAAQKETIQAQLEDIKTKIQGNKLIEESFNSKKNLIPVYDKLAYSRFEAFKSEYDLLKTKCDFAEFLYKEEKMIPASGTTPMNIKKLGYEYREARENLNLFTDKFYEQVVLESSELELMEIQLEKQLEQLEVNLRNTELTAPVSGFIQEISSLNVGDYIFADQKILNIVPATSSDYRIELRIPARDSGRIKKGMEVKLRFPAFPYYEFKGAVGTVKSIDPDTQAASNGELFFTVVTDIDTNTLKDRKGIEYPVKVGLEVDARLILESRTILYFLLKKVGVMV